MQTRFKKGAKVLDIVITSVAAIISVATVLYGVVHFGLQNTWPELVLNLFYIFCVVLSGMYFFNRLDSHRFNYWCSISVGMTVLMRDILFAPPMDNLVLRSACFTLSVLFLCTLTYFYARKEWKSYTKRNLWIIFAIDALIATLYQFDIMFFETADEATNYMLTEIWIRPTITYGLVACFVTEANEQAQ